MCKLQSFLARRQGTVFSFQQQVSHKCNTILCAAGRNNPGVLSISVLHSATWKYLETDKDARAGA